MSRRYRALARGGRFGPLLAVPDAIFGPGKKAADVGPVGDKDQGGQDDADGDEGAGVAEVEFGGGRLPSGRGSAAAK